MSNRSLTQIVYDLQKRIAALEAAPVDTSVGERVKTLENQYRMLNARLNKKNNNGEDPDRRRDPGKT